MVQKTTKYSLGKLAASDRQLITGWAGEADEGEVAARLTDPGAPSK